MLGSDAASPAALLERKTFTEKELQEFLIFSVCVAGHNAESTARAVQRLLDKLRSAMALLGFAGIGTLWDEPFIMIRRYVRHRTFGNFKQLLKESGIGCYTLRAQALNAISERIEYRLLNLRTCTPEDLERFKGIGPKTARFFLLYTQPTRTDLAILDVHVLRWMRTQGHDAPAQTPADRKRYHKLEKIFLQLAQDQGLLPCALDAAIWDSSRTATEDRRILTE